MATDDLTTSDFRATARLGGRQAVISTASQQHWRQATTPTRWRRSD